MRLVPGKAIEGIHCEGILLPSGFEKAKGLADSMVDFLESRHPDALGLAAPQIGKNVMLVVLREGIDAPWIKAVNPVLFLIDDDVFLVSESCLSYPRGNPSFVQVRRFKKVKLTYWDISGYEPVEISKIVDGIAAVVWQHEIDHLNGVTIYTKGF